MRTRQSKPVRRRYPVNRIKANYSYDILEIARLLGVHRNTVRHWLADGLVPLDRQRPTLVYGTSLKAFLRARQEARKQSCAIGEFYCFRCRLPRKAWGETADLIQKTEKTINLSALCSHCETPMNRAVRRSDLPQWSTAIDLQTPGQERLADWNNASLDSAMNEGEPQRHSIGKARDLLPLKPPYPLKRV